jgi:hypothetical protein
MVTNPSDAGIERSNTDYSRRKSAQIVSAITFQGAVLSGLGRAHFEEITLDVNNVWR